MSDHHAAFTDSLVRNMHTGSLLEIILQGSCCAPPVNAWTKEPIVTVCALQWPNGGIAASAVDADENSHAQDLF